ncbi:hypothetical protein INT43_000398 [Umbelopsis isabellina]|uniref:JAB1/MPN/MOV34 metalloenzyme domain-containing protein n=1 Tax=Mortierella isabellina TaxID=91625 RepID=A0A8H7Q3Q5_MORIS|nr:hypothetical protein INT43_000398 [Umbelopsis isabellina]
MPALSKVTITANVFHVMASHAASTEKEEIIGVLLGNWQEKNTSNPFSRDQAVAVVEAVCILTRSDKRKDRVEISPLQLHLAVVEAEKVEKELGRKICVVGWPSSYHCVSVSYRHVLNVRTQLSQQLMDERFFGLIVSCFDADADHTQRLQITCFQSNDDPERGPVQLKIPLQILPDLSMEKHTTQSIIDISQKIYEEQVKEFSLSSQRVQYQGKSEGTEENAMIVDTNPSNGEQSLPQKLSELYNSGVYGQSITSLVDKLIIPATELAKQRHAMNLLEIKRLESLRDARSRDENSFEHIV